MNWRVVLFLVVAVIGFTVLLEIITRIFALRGEQRLWLDIAGTCVVILLFVAWQRRRGE